jgi:hypothetical protein
MPARFVFLAATAAAAISSAALAGLAAAAAGLCAGMPGETIITLTADTAAAVFGGVIALFGIAASLFFSSPETASQDNLVPPLVRRHSAVSSTRPSGMPHFPGSIPGDSRLRAALEARALALRPVGTERQEQARPGMSRQPGHGTG